MDFPTLNPENIQREELLKLLEINPNTSTNDIINQINTLINKQIDEEIIDFLENAKDILSQSENPISQQVF